MSLQDTSRKQKPDKNSKRIDIKLILQITEEELIELPIANLRKLLKAKCNRNPLLDTTALFENLSEARKQAKKERRSQIETELAQFEHLCDKYSIQISEETKASLQQQRDELTREISFYKNELNKMNSTLTLDVDPSSELF